MEKFNQELKVLISFASSEELDIFIDKFSEAAKKITREVAKESKDCTCIVDFNYGPKTKAEIMTIKQV